MPIYEYNCAKCGNDFEHLAKSSTDRPVKCPSCGSRRLKKQFSPFATTKTFQLASGYGGSRKPTEKKPSEKASASDATCKSPAKSCDKCSSSEK
ncbi:MAG: zinc ribbon domain-containing protein [Kiritimatiellia bacterium]